MRRTFVVQVHEADSVTVLENVRTHERVRLGELEEIAQQIRDWLEHERPAAVSAGSALPADGARHGGAPAHAELLEDARQVRFHGGFTDGESSGELLVGQAGRGLSEDLSLAPAQLVLEHRVA